MGGSSCRLNKGMGCGDDLQPRTGKGIKPRRISGNSYATGYHGYRLLFPSDFPAGDRSGPYRKTRPGPYQYIPVITAECNPITFALDKILFPGPRPLCPAHTPPHNMTGILKKMPRTLLVFASMPPSVSSQARTTISPRHKKSPEYLDHQTGQRSDQ